MGRNSNKTTDSAFACMIVHFFRTHARSHSVGYIFAEISYTAEHKDLFSAAFFMAECNARSRALVCALTRMPCLAGLSELVTLTPLPALRQLLLAALPLLTEKTVVAIAKQLPSLAVIDLRKCRSCEVSLVRQQLPDVHVVAMDIGGIP